jgi:two-component system alkaline phosphatase synthesis response regulator PhoP
MRILLVDDEENIRDVVRLNLELEDYEVVTAADGKEALKKIAEQHFDLLILDVMLPEMDGFQICEKFRLRDRETPVLFLTAKNTTQDRVAGLKIGGDDYLTKPFDLEELLLRVNKLLRRTGKINDSNLENYSFNGNEINFSTFEAKGNQGYFTLTKKEALLLRLLIERKNKVVSRQQILQSVWDYDVYPSTRTIDNFILSFRKYFEKDPKHPKYFQSIRGIGYKFKEN